MIETLTGKLSSLPRPKAITERGGGGKFDTKGQAMFWPGNTFICHIHPTSHAHKALIALQSLIRKSEFGHLFTYLPPSSFHMTVFEGWAPFLNEQGNWPADLGSDDSRVAATARLQNGVRDLLVPQEFRVKPVDLFALHSVTLKGADDWQETSLRHTREILREATGIQSEDFAGYVFHITLAYQMKWVDKCQAKEMALLSKRLGRTFCNQITEIELGPCELCEFDSMHRFDTITKLGGGQSNLKDAFAVRGEESGDHEGV
ncbi:DUF1868 domain-containing protein [Roseibium sp. TrichSKD4]|uniref:DUF1868 domain-containing protein n=1 Tax=Roseibium sp. TrichSKD4 TaxID=744980 RepID=UPI0014391292|nr:DUF1868 domain-containing protein [Roseibium sp. TrichSKD4]